MPRSRSVFRLGTRLATHLESEIDKPVQSSNRLGIEPEWGPTSAHHGCSILSRVGTLLHRIVFIRPATGLGHNPPPSRSDVSVRLVRT